MGELSEEQENKSLILRDKLAKDFDEAKAEDFASSHKNKSWYDDFMLLFEMITDSDYTIATKTKLVIAGTLAYVVLPIDVIPDFLPIAGWLDDVFLLSVTINSLSEEIEKFKAYKENKGE